MRLRSAACATLLSSSLLLGACGASSEETFTKTVAALDGTYLATVQISQAAIASGLLDAQTVKALLAADNLAYAEILPLTQAAAASATASEADLVKAENAVSSFKALTVKANDTVVSARGVK